jgi:hypothetical protein
VTGAPLLMLIVIGFMLAGSGIVLTWSRVHLYRDMRRNSDANMKKLLDRSSDYYFALTDVRDVLADIIASSYLDDKEQAIAAYDKVTTALRKGNR